MVMIVESSPSMISVISDSTSLICLSNNAICSTDCVTCKDWVDNADLAAFRCEKFNQVVSIVCRRFKINDEADAFV